MNRSHLNVFFSFFFKNPKAFLVALLLGGLSYCYEVFVARDTMTFHGIPQAMESSLATYTRIFRNSAYMVGYSDLKGTPLWVVYKLTPLDETQKHLDRPSSFRTDWRNFGLITSNDYTNSGYDRGHMAPNHAIALLYGKEAQQETFLMTNVVPQKASLNQKLWQRLETMELDTFAPKFKELWVYTGPLFDLQSRRLKSSFWVEIPNAFYKIYVGVEEGGAIRTLALIVPQNAKANDTIQRYLVSIDEVERRSGFDFLHQLDDTIENALEKEIDTTRWF